MFDTLTLRKDSEAFHEVLRNSRCEPFNPVHMKGEDVTGATLAANGFDTPFLVPCSDNLGLTIPPGLTVSAVVQIVGPTTKIPVLDVGTQQGRSMTLGEWGEYWELGKERVAKMGQLNVISMEVSHTEFGQTVTTPRAVRDIDWIDTIWKAKGGDNVYNYPKVQLYCLMGTGGSYTDFHIDFGGTSVWYHIVSGEKWFYLIPPTAENLRAYESWTSSASQNAVFFPDMLAPGQCTQLKFTTGNTLFIPSGWIHAVYTPRDTLVFGGNFLHNMSSQVQLKIYDLENRTHVSWGRVIFLLGGAMDVCTWVLTGVHFCPQLVPCWLPIHTPRFSLSLLKTLSNFLNHDFFPLLFFFFFFFFFRYHKNINFPITNCCIVMSFHII